MTVHQEVIASLQRGLDTILEIEEGAETEAAHYQAIQRAINAGTWGLQGSFGRTMMAAIEDGYCMLGQRGASDYWGNYIPSREQVQDGTKGSPGFVEERMGSDWLAMMEAA